MNFKKFKLNIYLQKRCWLLVVEVLTSTLLAGSMAKKCERVDRVNAVSEAVQKTARGM